MAKRKFTIYRLINNMIEPLLETEKVNFLLGMLMRLPKKASEEPKNIFIQTRQAEGIKSALANGVKFGRPKSEIPKDFIRVYELYRQGLIKVKDVMSMYNIAKSTFYKYAESIKG